MCFSDVRRVLAANGIGATTSQIRWAIDAGHVTRPPRDGSLRFEFSEQHVAELVSYFQSKATREVVDA